MSRFLAVLAAFGLSAMLASCATVPAEQAAETAEYLRSTASPTSEATPAPEVTEVAAEIVVHADRVLVVADDGSLLDSADLFADRDDLVETLTDALGAEPTVTPRPGGHEWRPGFRYDWNGVSLFLADGEWDQFAADVTRLEVTTATVNGVAIRTEAGIAVGSPSSELDPSTAIGQIDGGSIFHVGAETVGTYIDLGPGGDPATPLITSVSVFADTTAVIRITVPATNWGV